MKLIIYYGVIWIYLKKIIWELFRGGELIGDIDFLIIIKFYKIWLFFYIVWIGLWMVVNLELKIVEKFIL